MIVGLAMMATVFVIQVRDVSASDPPSSTWEILPLDRATGINDKGMVVGFIGENIARWIPGGDVGPVLGPYETEVWDGDAIIVPPPTIDNSGAIAGTIRNNGRWLEGAPYATAFYWSEDTGVVAFSGGGNMFSLAVDINNEGQVAGVSEDVWGYVRPFIYDVPTGQTRIPPSDPDDYYGWHNFVCGLNDQGQLLGGDTLSALWLWEWGESESPRMTIGYGALGCRPGTETDGWLNSQGEVLGGNSVYSYPTGWHILPLPYENYDAGAFAINDVGQVIGYHKYGGRQEVVLWNPTSSDTWEIRPLGEPPGTYWCEHGHINDQGAVAASCWGSFSTEEETYDGETARTFLWTPTGGWSDPLPTFYPTGTCVRDGDGTCIQRLDWSEPRGINERSQIIADSFVGEDDDYQYDPGDPVYARALLYDPLIFDVDGDGFNNDFEAGFGGNLKIFNLETGHTAVAQGSAETGSVITSGSFTVQFPPGTTVASDAPQIGMEFLELPFLPGLGYASIISGADLGGGTKTVTMPFLDVDHAVVCVIDQVEAMLTAPWWCVGGGGTEIPIPEIAGQLVTQDNYEVERISTDPPIVRVSGLSHTALVTIADTDLDGVPDWDDLCPTIPGFPEKQGCPLKEPVAPEVTITAPASGFLAPVYTPVTFSGSFTDENLEDTHTAAWAFDNAQVPCVESCTLTESGGSGTVEYTREFESPGVYAVSLTVTDSSGLQGHADTVNDMPDMPAFVVVYDPMGGFVTGGGWINSPPGAYSDNPALAGKATFGFVAKYQKGADVPSGQTEFQFKVADMDFHSTSYDWLVCGGPKCQFKGKGTVNGFGNYGFLLSAIDGQVPGGGGADKLRMKIWDIFTGQIIYDNQPRDGDYADPTTVIGGGSIVIHKG